ncbi:MAG: Transketolase [Gammaproteobacteria bacterium]|nr:Transketolase [Gammaproteobacteria bacterium]
MNPISSAPAARFSRSCVHTRDLQRLAARIRINATEMVAPHGFGYLGQALSSADFLAVLFGGGYIRPTWDRFILSPGHYAVAFYAVAVEMGLIDRAELRNYGADGALLEAISTERTPVVDITCGSLGQGLSGAIGFALAARFAGDDRHVFAFLSDGEMEEGQTWEAALFASHHRLEGLTAFIDANDSQVDGPVSSVTTIAPLLDKWRSFGWAAVEIDGHDLREIQIALESGQTGKPLVVIGRTHVTGGLRSIPATMDGHFVKLSPEVTAAVIAELELVGEQG